jgi:Acyl-CoA reductase (LuxC)
MMVRATLLAERPVRSIVAAIAAAAARWSDGDFQPRAQTLAAVSARTGYSLPVVGFAFDRLFESLQRETLEAVVSDELGALDVLDGFASKPRRPRARALPIGRVCIVSSRTTIGVAVIPAVFALCAKCEVLVKDREDHLVAAFFATLAEELPDFRDAARAQTWSGNSDAVDLAGFDAVVAFGNDRTLAHIGAGLPPTTRFIPYATKASAGYVTRETLSSQTEARRIAAAAARDLVLYDTEGCLSLHALFVERGGLVSAEQFSLILAASIEDAARAFPLGHRSPEIAAQLAHARDLAAFRASGLHNVYSDERSTYLAVLDPPPDSPPAFLPRALAIYSVDAPAEAAAYLDRHGVALEALAVSVRRSDVLDLALRLGAARVASFGELQAPPLGAYHGGRPRVAEFVRWVSDDS